MFPSSRCTPFLTDLRTMGRRFMTDCCRPLSPPPHIFKGGGYFLNTVVTENARKARFSTTRTFAPSRFYEQVLRVYSRYSAALNKQTKPYLLMTIYLIKYSCY